MNGCFLRFYVHEDQRIHRTLLWEWLLQQANKLGIRGGSAFRAMAGFGSHHVLHEDHFFELAGTLTVEVEFIVTDDEVDQLYDSVYEAAVALMEQHPERARQATHLLFAAHHLERLADRVTNIGEDVVYLVTGRVEDLNP